MSPWIQGGDPVSMVRINNLVEKFKVGYSTQCTWCIYHPMPFGTGKLEDRRLLARENKTVLSEQQPPTHSSHVPTSKCSCDVLTPSYSESPYPHTLSLHTLHTLHTLSLHTLHTLILSILWVSIPSYSPHSHTLSLHTLILSTLSYSESPYPHTLHTLILWVSIPSYSPYPPHSHTLSLHTLILWVSILSTLSQAEYEQQLVAEEQQRLAAMVTALSETDRQKVYRKGVELLEEQNSNESAECLPTVLISGGRCVRMWGCVICDLCRCGQSGA